MKPRSESKVWTVEIALEESAEETEAKATLGIADRRVGGWGRARRNPSDPDVPRVGEELAAARALSDLANTITLQCRGLCIGVGAIDLAEG